MNKTDSKDSKVKKVYEKPKVAFERELEALAGICDDKGGGGGICKATFPDPCDLGFLLS